MTVDRLTDGREIAAVLRGRHQRAGRLSVVHVRQGDQTRAPRFAVVASRRVGNAVTRNRAKRLLREAARRLSWRDGVDIVLVARARCGGSGMQEVYDELRTLAGKLDALDQPVSSAAPASDRA